MFLEWKQNTLYLVVVIDTSPRFAYLRISLELAAAGPAWLDRSKQSPGLCALNRAVICMTLLSIEHVHTAISGYQFAGLNQT